VGAESAESRFAINLDGNTADVSSRFSSEVEQLRQRIASSTDMVKQMASACRALRGDSDAVAKAKGELKAKLDAERDAISKANLALLQQGTTYEKVAGEAKDLAEQKKKLDAELKSKAVEEAKSRTDAMTNAVRVAGGPVETLRGKFDALEGVLSGTGGVMGAVTLAVAGTVAAIAALAGVIVAATVAFVKFVAEGANTARSMNLVREAATGSAENAKNLGTQVDALAAKVPTAKNELNELAVRLDRTRLSGQAIVDTFNAVGQTSAAMGDEVGKQLENIITRGQMAQRIQINPLELQGSGLQFKDIAGQLAANLNIGVEQAKAALFEGRVKLDDGAKAIRDAVDKRFGEINARKLLDLGVQAEKFKEKLTALTSDVKLEPLLKGFDTLSHLFDSTTVSGAALKQLVTFLGDQIGPAFQAAAPIAAQFFKGMVIASLEVTIGFLKLKKQFKETFGSDTLKDLDLAGVALKYYAGLGRLVADAFDRMAAAMRLFGDVKDTLANAKGLGTSITDGVVDGVESGTGKVTSVVGELAAKVKAAFAGPLEIHSPSRVFKRQGNALPEGVAGGVVEREGVAVSAVDRMAEQVARAGATGGGFASAHGFVEMAATPPTTAPAPGARGAAASSTRIDVGGIAIHVDGGGKDVAKQLSDPSFIAQLTQALKDALLAAGVPTEAT
jgi:hypothetical protein